MWTPTPNLGRVRQEQQYRSQQRLAISTRHGATRPSRQLRSIPYITMTKALRGRKPLSRMMALPLPAAKSVRGLNAVTQGSPRPDQARLGASPCADSLTPHRRGRGIGYADVSQYQRYNCNPG